MASRSRPEVLAFLTDSKENPDDDTPRLVLADWLTEHGDERGDFMRLQCLRHRGDASGPSDRESELLARHQPTWLGILAEKGIKTDMRRGLVEASALPRKLLSKRLASLSDYEPFAWVDCLSLYSFTAEDLPKLAASPHWQRLTTLNCRQYHYYADDLMDPKTVGNSKGNWSALSSLAVLAGLTEFDLNCQDIGIDGAKALAAVPDMKRLRRLGLARNNLGNSGISALTACSSLTQLTELNLASNRIQGAGFAALANWPALVTVKTLTLGGNYPGDEGIASLASSPYLGELRELRLGGDWPGTNARAFGLQRFGRAGAEALAKATSLSRLNRLELTSNRIGPEGAEALAAASALPCLTELILSANEIGDVGAVALARSAALKGLKVLDLRYNAIGDHGAKALANSPHLSELTLLGLTANRDMSPEGIAALRDRFGNKLAL